VKSWIIRLATLTAVLGLTGCAFKAGFNPAYLPNQPMALGIPGKGLVVIASPDDTWVVSSHPTSLTGSATSLTVPLGAISHQIALRVFGAAFKDGVDFRNEAGNVEGYRLVIKPKVAKFTYAYNQLKNLGFAITPQIDLELHVQLIAPDGRSLLEKTYASGIVDGDTYVISGQPSEKVNQLLHLTLFKLMTDAAIEAKDLLKTN
jgi:hypothetical protein